MPLSKAEIERYYDDGYVIPDYRLSKETLQDIRSDHDRLIERHPEYRDYCPMLLRYDLSFLNYARDPNILDMVEQVMGAPFILPAMPDVHNMHMHTRIFFGRLGMVARWAEDKEC